MCSNHSFVKDTGSEFAFTPVHTLVEMHAARTPEAIAATCAGQRLTYDQLNRRANRLAEYLRLCGAKPETTVAIVMDRSLDLFVAILAVLKSGAGYLPVDMRNPADRVHSILKDSSSTLVLTDGNQSVNLSRYDVIDISSEGGLIATMPDWNIPSPVQPDSSIGFDAHIPDFFNTWIAGECLHIASPEAQDSAEELFALLRDEGMTHAMLQEIEHALEAHPDVLTAIVTAPEDPVGSRKLAAYVALKPQPEVWPIVCDERRNDAYMAAIRKSVAGRIVVEIGTGSEAMLARMCVAAGARKVYAIERLEKSFEQAGRRISDLGLAERIALIHGDSRMVQLPEQADVCVCGIVGAIGGSEGAAVLIEDARRFLKPGGLMIPDRSVTRIAAVTLPETLVEEPRFSAAARHCVEEMFRSEKRRFDPRIGLKGIGPEALLSDSGVFEELNFNSVLQAKHTHNVTLVIQKSGLMHGLLVWLTLETGAGETVDVLQNPQGWLPVYFPLSEDGIVVSAGDRVKAVILRTPCKNALNPDFRLAGSIVRRGAPIVQFKYESSHSMPAYRSNGFYEALFADGAEAEPAESLDLQSARAFLKKRLPEYMLPSHLVVMDRFPVTSSGKIDRNALLL